MRTITALVYVSLDGVVEEPAWTAPYFDAEHAAFARERLFAADSLLLGRATFDAFSKVWPAMTDGDGFADRMNGLPKHVVSSTLVSADWNATVLGGDPVEQVGALKQEEGGDILVYGSATLLRGLLPHGLVDRLLLWLHPVVLGGGARMFPEGTAPTALDLAGVIPFASGAVVLDYRPVEAAATGPATSEDPADRS